MRYLTNPVNGERKEMIEFKEFDMVIDATNGIESNKKRANKYICVEDCLVCKGEIIEYFNLGLQPLVNNLKSRPEEVEDKYPTVVMECPSCTHKQLSIAVKPSILFSNYLYQTGTSKRHLAFFEHFVRDICIPGNRVLDIGSNDGSLLKAFEGRRRVLTGVEPSNLEDKSGGEIIRDFFPTDKLKGREFDIITAFNVFSHNRNPNKFLKEMGKLLDEHGRIYILNTKFSVDNVYHEHISYFTPASMAILINKCELELISYRKVSMHGESDLYEIGKRKGYNIADFVIKGNIVGYGASAHGIVYMNYYGIKPEYVVDDNVLKQGKFIAGINVEIKDISFLAKDTRDLTIVIFAYHLFEDIYKKIKSVRPNKKDIFVHPIKGVL